MFNNKSGWKKKSEKMLRAKKRELSSEKAPS